MYSGPVSIQVNGGRQGDPRLPFLINRGRVLLGPMLRHSEARGSLGVQKNRYVMDDGSYAEAIATPYVNIIAIHLVTGGEEGEEEEEDKEKYEYPHVFSTTPLYYFTDALTWVQAWNSYTPATDLAPEKYSWAGGVSGARGTPPAAEPPCGNMTWFGPPQPAEGQPLEEAVKTRKLATVLSWNGPVTGDFPDVLLEESVTGEAFFWIDFPETETFKIAAPGPVVSVALIPPTGLQTGLRLAVLVLRNGSNAGATSTPIEIERLDYAPDEAGLSGDPWVPVWTALFDEELDYLRTHIRVSPDGSEARGLAQYQADYTDPDPNVDPTRHAGIKTTREFVINMVTGAVTYDWDDYATFPRFRESRVVSSTESVGPNNYKRYYIKNEVTAGTTTEFTVSHQTGANTSTHERVEMPYPGEVYCMNPDSSWRADISPPNEVWVYPRSVFRVLTCTPAPDLAAETTDYLQRRVDMMQPDGTYRGRWAVLTVEWLHIGEDPQNAGAPMVHTVDSRPGILNNDGQCHVDFRYDEDNTTTAHLDETVNAKVIVGTGYDLDGSLVRAFLEPEYYSFQFSRLAFGHMAGKPLNLASADPEVWGTSTPPAEWAEDSPEDVNGADYSSYYLDGYNWHRTYLKVEGGRADGKRIQLTCFGRRVDNKFRYTGYFPQETPEFVTHGQFYLDKGGAKYDYQKSFPNRQYKNSILQWYHPERITGVPGPDVYVNLQRGMGAEGEWQVNQFGVEWLNLQDFLLVGTPNGEPRCDVYYAKDSVTAGFSVVPYNTWNDILADSELGSGFQADTDDGLMPPAAATISQTTDGVYSIKYGNEWLRAYYHAPENETYPGQLDADSQVLGVYGEAGLLGNVSVSQKVLVSFSCHPSNSVTRTRTFYSWNGNATTVGPAGNYPYAGAVGYNRVAVSSLFSPWRGVPGSSLDATFKYLYGNNTKDMVFVNPEAGKTWHELFLPGQTIYVSTLSTRQVLFGRREKYARRK